MKRLLMIIGLLLAYGCAFAARPDTLYISVSQTVHLRFSSELKYVNLGSREILAKIVDGAKDFVAIRAREPFDFWTSLSCLETNGAMHTFLVAYSDIPPRLDIDTRLADLPSGEAGIPTFPAQADTVSFSSLSLERYADMPQELYHIGTKAYGIEVLCENLFYKDDVLFLVVSLRNCSAVSYEMSTPRFAVESRRLGRRGVQYEKAVVPRAAFGQGVVAPGATGRMVFTFDKISLVKGQVFRGYFYEKGGGRNMGFSLGTRDVNGARML